MPCTISGSASLVWMDSSISLPKRLLTQPAHKQAQAKRSNGAQLAGKRKLQVQDQHDSPEDDTALLKAELVHAREAHAATERAVAEILAKVRAGEEIDNTGVHKTLDPMMPRWQMTEQELNDLIAYLKTLH